MKLKNWGCLIGGGAGLFVVVSIGISLLTPPRPSLTLEENSRSPPNASETKWYAGGTLHDETMAEWRAAGQRNRLATSADFLANYANAKGETLAGSFAKDGLVYQAAVGLANCIDESGSSTPSLKVSEVAVACLLLSERQ